MKRVLIALAVLAAGLALAVMVGLWGLGYYLSPQDKLTKADVVVAISGGDTEARTTEAVRLYKQGLASHVIFSGAALDVSSPSNAAAMAKIATRQGVPAAAIELDEAAANTRQNASGVAAIVEKHHYRSVILVTSPYHQRRASIVFKRALGGDIALINHSSPDLTWRRSHWWATAYSQNLTLSELQKVIYELASERNE
jgi:uncharacterized SAM-binding protein YcdF (DUF218 family)